MCEACADVSALIFFKLFNKPVPRWSLVPRARAVLYSQQNLELCEKCNNMEGV